MPCPIIAKISVLILATFLLQFSQCAFAAPWSLQVVDENGRSVQAQVRISSRTGEEAPVLQTDATGRAAGDIKPFSENYLGDIFIFAPGHAPSGGALRSGENRAKLGAPHTIKGRVVGDDQKPLANVLVALRNVTRDTSSKENPTLENSVEFYLTDSAKDLFSTRTDAGGRYEIHNLPARGKANIVVSDPLWQSVRVRVNLQNAVEAPALKTRPAARLGGRVLDAEGAPVAGKIVYVANQNTEIFDRTDAAGHYALGGLPAGETNIEVASNPERDSTVAAPVKAIAVIGQEVQVPDLRMTPGALLEIEITPPVSSVHFDLRREGLPNRQSGIPLKSENGKIRAHVSPGAYRLKINVLPKGWLAPADVPEDGLKIQAMAPRAGSTPSPKITLRLQPALTMNGVAQDETGAPVAGVIFQESNDAMLNAIFEQDAEKAAVSDAAGRFVLRDLKPGEIGLSTDKNWDIVSPKTITLPAKKTIVVTLRKVLLASLPLRGRVVDERGQPIQNVKVHISWSGPVDEATSFFSKGEAKTAFTDADGRYEVFGLRADSSVTLRVEKAHYRFMSGGEPTFPRTIQAIDGGQMPNSNPIFQVPDIVLQSLERQVSGRVLNQNGAPVANAIVSALGGGQDNSKAIVGVLGGGQEEILVAPRNITRTDNAGRFTLHDLPAGDLSFVAGAGDGFAQVQSTENELPDMVLQTQTKPEEDFDLAQKIVMDLIAVTDNTYYARATLPYTLVLYDYGTALQAANALHPDKPNQPDDLRVLVILWIDSSPESARAALPAMLPMLEQNSNDPWFGNFVVQVASLLEQPTQKVVPGESADAAFLRAWVRQQFETMRDKAAALDLSKDNDLPIAYGLSWLAAVSEKLGEEDADKWAQAAIEVAARHDAMQKTARDADLAPATAQVVAAGGARLAQAALSFVPPEQRAYALGRIIPEIAKDDLSGARRLLELLPQQIEPENTNIANARPAWAFGLAAKAILRRMSTPDAADALALARRVTVESERGEALALAARLQPEAQAATLFREAFDVESQRETQRNTPLIASIALAANPKIGNELLMKFEDRFFDVSQWRRDSPPSMVETAFYLARTQPGRARAWLEWEWTRTQNTVGAINASVKLETIAMAMSAVSTSRALEMANVIPPEKKADGSETLTWRWEAKRKIAQYLLAPESARETLNFSRWDASDTWTPGTDTGW